jgi:flagellar hook-associated protein 2
VTGGTAEDFQLDSGDYSTTGSATGIVSSLDNFTVTGVEGGQTGLLGTITFASFQADYDGDTDELTISFVKNGVTYTSNAITANTSINAGANEGIESGTVITFTADSGGDNETSFDITIGSDIIIDASEDNVETFRDDLISGVSDISIYQSREISSFDNNNVKSPLSGLDAADIRFISNSYNATTGNFGNISNFEVKYSTGTDGAISVVIGGETFRATGLGTTLNSNLTLESTTSDKSLVIGLGDAGESIDISTSSDALDFEKSLEYAFGTREIVDFTVESGDSLNDIIFSLNQLTSTTGLSASIIQVNEFDFRLSLKSINEGVENAYEFFDDSNVLTNAGISEIQAATDALLRIDGIEIERSSNTITDAIEDVTLNIFQATPDYNEVSPESINVEIDNDVDSIITGIVGFLDAYNAVRVFNSQQNEREADFSFAEDAILGGDNVLASLADSIVAEISKIVANASDDDFDSLSDAGIITSDFVGSADTPSTANILSYDENTLRSALTANFDKIRNIFEMNAVTSDSALTLSESSNSFSLYEFQLEIDTSADVGEQVKLLNSDGTDYLDGSGQNVYLEFSGGTITGASGTVVDGLEFLYIGDGSDTISVNITQGIADRLYNVANAYVEEDGIIDTTVEGLVEQNEDYQDDITTAELRLETFVSQLRAQFVALEAAISSVNSILGFLEADSNARNNNN